MKHKHDLKLPERAKIFFTNAHRHTNHWYDEKLNLRYDFHLGLTALIVYYFSSFSDLTNEEIEEAIAAAWGHDAVSDARLTYNDIRKGILSTTVAQLCCNLCEDVWGINRDERNSPSYYARIRSHKLSVYVKLCDRIANVIWSIFTESSMFEKYKREHSKFKESLTVPDAPEEFSYLWDYLDDCFNGEQYDIPAVHGYIQNSLQK